MLRFKRRIILSIIIVVGLMAISYSPSAQEKTKPETAPKEAGPFTIAQLVVGTGVEDRKPVGVAESFPATTERVYCFLLAYDVMEDTQVSFVWYHGQNELLKTDLPLKKGPRWRTFAYKNLYSQKGEWKVEIRDAAGKPLKEIKFLVE